MQRKISVATRPGIERHYMQQLLSRL